MAESVTNRGKYLLSTTGTAALNWRACVITGTQTGVHSVDLNTVADLDAVTGVSIHTERIDIDAGVTATEDDANDRVNIDSGNITFAAAPGVTAQGVAFYHEGGGTDATRELVSVHTTGFPQPMDGGLVVNVSDFLRLT